MAAVFVWACIIHPAQHRPAKVKRMLHVSIRCSSGASRQHSQRLSFRRNDATIDTRRGRGWPWRSSKPSGVNYTLLGCSLFVGVVVIVVMRVGMRVRQPFVRMFMAVLCAWRRRIRMRVIMVTVVMRMLMRMSDVVVCVGVRMVRHRYLPSL